MPIRIVRLGTPRHRAEGLRLGTVRRPPRGVKKEDFAKRDFYDVWLPELAPAAETVAIALSSDLSAKSWKTFEKTYRREMSGPAAQHLLGLLAALSHTTDFSVGCYCEDETRCHRSILRQLLVENGAQVHD